MMNLRPSRYGAMHSFNPTFQVTSWPAMTPLMQEMSELTNSMAGWNDFGWVRSGDQLGWRSSFDDVDSMLANVSSVTPLLNRMLREAATLDRLGFVGPVEQMARIKNETARIAASVANKNEHYFENIDDLQTSYFRKTPSVAAGAQQVQQNTLCTMTPHYTIKNWSVAQPLMQSILNKSNLEPGCTYFGWAKGGDQLHSKETFVNGAALEAHVAAVKPLMNALISSNAVTLEHMEITGPSAEVEKVKHLVADLKPEILTLEQEGPSLVEASA